MTYPVIQTDRVPLIDSETYESMYERSMNEPEAFWAEQAETFIDWEKSGIRFQMLISLKERLPGLRVLH